MKASEETGRELSVEQTEPPELTRPMLNGKEIFEEPIRDVSAI